jgi:hypothetical protein
VLLSKPNSAFVSYNFLFHEQSLIVFEQLSAEMLRVFHATHRDAGAEPVG